MVRWPRGYRSSSDVRSARLTPERGRDKIPGRVPINEAVTGRSLPTSRCPIEPKDRAFDRYGKEDSHASTSRAHREARATHVPDSRWDGQPSRLHGSGAGP